MTSVIILIIASAVVLLLALQRSSLVTKGEKVARSMTVNLKAYQEQFGERTDAQHYLKDVLADANRVDRYKPGGSGAIGMRLADGDLGGAALLTVGKVAVDGAIGLLGKVSKGLFRSGQRAVAGDGPKSEDQGKWEEAIRRELNTLLDLRRSAANLKTTMWAVGGGGAFVALIVFMSETIR
jgi:hypothetical protein